MKFLFILPLLAAPVSAQTESWDQLQKHWEYARTAPLDYKEISVEDRDGSKVYDISYAAPADSRAASIGPSAGTVPAYLVVPQGKGPFAAVLYGHWCMPGSEKMNRREFLDEALVLAHSGVVSLLPDHVIARPGFVEDKAELNTQQIDVLVQQVISMRRGLDLLTGRKDVDRGRIAYVGHSCDGSVAGLLSGIESKRLKAVVIMAGAISDEVFMRTKPYQEYRQKVGPEKLDAFAAKYSWTDPGKYVSQSQGVEKLLQYASNEPQMPPEVARQFLPYVADPKVFKVYQAEHALNPEATRDRIAFLSRQLRVKAPNEKLVATIPALVQPPWPK